MMEQQNAQQQIAVVDATVSAAAAGAGEPPEKIASDYIELVSLILLFLVGAPLNLAAWTQIAERPISSRLDILKKHLNYTDLLVIFIYVPSRACWLITYDWRGGDLLCRLTKFMHTFAFQISSNVIVCIALDRLLSVLSASHRNPEQAARRMRLMLLVAWITALFISSPQFAVWRVFQAFDDPPWSQCMQVWEIQRVTMRRALMNAAAAAVNGTNATNTNNNNAMAVNQLMYEENVYVVLHMLLIFWIPALIIMLCYALLSLWVWVNSRPNLFDLATATAMEKAAAEQHHNAMHQHQMQQMQHFTNGNGRMSNLQQKCSSSEQKQQLQKDQNAQQQQQQNGGGNNGSGGGGGGLLTMAIRPHARVSYQLASTNSFYGCTQGPDTVNTTLLSDAVLPHSSSAKKPMIVINDDMNRPVPYASSPSPQQHKPAQQNGCNGTGKQQQQQTTTMAAGEQPQQRNSSTPEASAAVPMLASNRQRQSSSYSAKSQRNRAIRVSFLLVMGYFACWLPYNCLSLVHFIAPELYQRHATKVYSLHGIIVFNSVINPYLYGLCGGLCRQRRRNS